MISITKTPNNTYYLVGSLILLAGAIYLKMLSNDFQMQWDDQWMVYNSYTKSGFTFENIKKIFTEFNGGQYAPINQLYYVLLHAFFGYDPFWYHLGSLVIHICNVILIFFLLKKLLFLSKEFPTEMITRIAFITALLMDVHPFLVEAVAWVSASKVILYAFFYILALHSYLKFLETNSFKHYLFSLFCFCLSLGCKEQAVTFPICLLLMDYFIGRNLKSPAVWYEKIIFFVLALAFGLLTIYAQGSMDSFTHNVGVKYGANMLYACYGLIEYITKCIVPINLLYLYPFPELIGSSISTRFWINPLIILVVLFSFWEYMKQKSIFFGVAFFLIHILLVLHFLPMSRFAIVADRYAYLSSIGAFFIIAILFNHVVAKRIKYYKTIAFAGVLYVLALALYAQERTAVWKNSSALKKQIYKFTDQKSYK